MWETKNITVPTVVWHGARASGVYLATVIHGDSKITRKFLIAR
jgi:hypothetical protein